MEPEAHFAVAEADEASAAKTRGRMKMDAAWWGTFALLMVAMCLTVTGELLLKNGMNRHGQLDISASTFVSIAVKLFTNPFVFAGFVFVFAGALFWLAVLSRWPLSLAYPFLSISYIIGIAASVLFLGEKVTPIQLLGVLIIVAGVSLVGLGSQSAPSVAP